MFEKVLIANRGEIAIRVARTLKEMGIGSVAVYSEIDRDAPHVREADEAFLVGPAVPAESYLNVIRSSTRRKEAGAEAIHPGYGFLAENADFARACAEAGIVFIGPPPEAIESMGCEGAGARDHGRGRGADRPGAAAPAKDVAAATAQAEDAGYPVAFKAAGGGGGKGSASAMSADDLAEAFEGAAREGERSSPTRASTSSATSTRPAPRRGPGARRLAWQRGPPRRARLLAPAPPPEGDRGGAGPRVDAELRERIGRRHDAAAAVGYRSAGTVEGLLQAATAVTSSSR